MKSIYTSLFVLGALLVSVQACKPKKTVTISKTDCASTYTKDVAPIINKYCAGSCHSASKKMYGIDLSSYEMVKEEAMKKRFMGSIKHEGLYPHMPKKGAKLSDSTIAVINCWIEGGYKQ
jgi:hypothetical protein